MGHITIVPERVRPRSFVYLEVARLLVERGYRVTYLGDEASRADATAAGATFVELRGLPLHLWLPPEGSKAERLTKLPADLRARRRRLDEQVDRFDVPWARTTLRDVAPDLIVSDVENPAQIVAARAEDIPVVGATVWFEPFKRPGNPPLHTSIVPGQGVAGSRAGIELAWAGFRSKKHAKSAATWVRDAGVDLGSVVRHLVAGNGLSTRAELDHRQWLRPASFRNVPVIGLSPSCLEFPGRPHATFHPASAVVPPVDDTRLDPELAAFLDTNAASGRPLVYASFGSVFTGDDADFLDRALTALARRTDRDVVVGLGGRSPQAGSAPVPDHVRVLDVAPQVEVLARADAALLHAGVGSVSEALRHGVPIVSYPYRGVMDQEGTAARVEAHGVGVVGERSESADEIEARIAHVLADETIRRRAARMQQAMEDDESSERLVRTVESFLPASAAD